MGFSRSSVGSAQLRALKKQKSQYHGSRSSPKHRPTKENKGEWFAFSLSIRSVSMLVIFHDLQKPIVSSRMLDSHHHYHVHSAHWCHRGHCSRCHATLVHATWVSVRQQEEKNWVMLSTRRHRTELLSSTVNGTAYFSLETSTTTTKAAVSNGTTQSL